MEKGKRTAAATGHGAAVVGGEPEGDEGSTAHAPAGCQQRQLGCVAPGQTPAERRRGGGGRGGQGPRGLVASLSGGKGGGGGSVGRGAPGVRSSLARRPGVARTLRRVASPRPPESLTARADITHRAGEQRGRGSSVGTVHGRTGAEVGCGTAAAARHSDSGSKAKSQTAIRSLACCEGIRRERENRLEVCY
jgi:hypothetical protein